MQHWNLRGSSTAHQIHTTCWKCCLGPICIAVVFLECFLFTNSRDSAVKVERKKPRKKRQPRSISVTKEGTVHQWQCPVSRADHNGTARPAVCVSEWPITRLEETDCWKAHASKPARRATVSTYLKQLDWLRELTTPRRGLCNFYGFLWKALCSLHTLSRLRCAALQSHSHISPLMFAASQLQSIGGGFKRKLNPFCPYAS